MDRPVLEALRHALGARWVRVMQPGAPVPVVRARRFRSAKAHLLRIDIPQTNPARQLVCALTHEPTTEDTLLAGAVARSMQPEPKPSSQRGPRRLTSVVEALRADEPGRPQAILDAALTLAGATNGGFARTKLGEAGVLAVGIGRPVLREAAKRAAQGASGEVVVEGRTFLLLPLTHGGRSIGGLALEGASRSPELDLFMTAAAAALDSSPLVAEAAPSHEDLRAVVAAFPIPAVAVSSGGTLIGISPEAESLFGLTADFDLGQPAAGRLGLLDPVAAGGHVSGHLVIAEQTFEPVTVPIPSGGRVVLLWDRTKEEALERIQEDLVASVAHELRTPIASVQGLIQLLRLRASKLDPETMAALLADGEKETARLERLIEDLLLAARIATGGIVPVPGAIDLDPIAGEITQRARDRYPDRTFEVSGDAEAHADPALTRHALWHLVDNAAKFGNAGGRVTVEIVAEPDGPEVRVHDDGPGIYSGDLPNLFRRFHQVDASSTRRVGGAGLGLFLVKEIVESQGGRISVRSRLGKGSTFTVKLLPARDDD